MAEHREELVFTAIRADGCLDSRASESPQPIAPRDESLGLYDAGARRVPDDNIRVVYRLLSVERSAGKEWS